ncbi:MAG: hypothetical protein KKH83_05990, partial [Candidatus Margulisbacteria bacterium]|nr:hypothetical protein [Candidatus Margulisiibacteriota bacterium]
GLTNYEFGVNIDFICWKNLYFLMGANFLFPPSGVPEVAINSLGLEYNHPLGKGHLIAGLIFNRSYIKDNNGRGHMDWSYHLGYKYRWLKDYDWVTYLGMIPQALLKDDLEYKAGQAYFIRSGVEVYF